MAESSSVVKSGAGGSTGRRYFSLEEARRALPLVRRIAADIQQAQAERLRLHGEMSAAMASVTPGIPEKLQKEFEAQTDRLDRLVEELTKVGVELKDPGRGLLDFPGMFEGREICLCWRLGEETITHWHELESGFTGRKPVEMLGG